MLDVFEQLVTQAINTWGLFDNKMVYSIPNKINIKGTFSIRRQSTYGL